MEKIPPSSSLNLPPTPRQSRAIAKLAQELAIPNPIEHDPTNRLEARNLMFSLRERVKLKNIKGR